MATFDLMRVEQDLVYTLLTILNFISADFNFN